MDDLWVPRGGEVDWEGAENLTALSGQDFALRLESLCEEGRALGYRREVLQGRKGYIRAESVGRAFVALPPQELVQVVLGDVPARRPATASARDLP